MIQQMAILFIIMLVGLFAYHLKMITADSSKKLSSLVVNIANPCFVVSSVTGNHDGIAPNSLILTFIVIAGLFVVLMLLAMVLPVILRVPEKSKGVYRAMTVFSNIGFMGFPIISGIYGKEALLYAAIGVLPYNFLIYTYGVYIMRAEDGQRIKFNVMSLMNPGVAASVIAIMIYAMNIRLPYVLTSCVDMIGNLTAPLSMMVIGASFATMNLKEAVKDVKLLIFCAIKLLIIPIAGVLVIRLLIHNEIIIGVCTVFLATPVGSMVAMLANEYGGDTQMASKGVAVSSILSVITLSIVSLVVGM